MKSYICFGTGAGWVRVGCGLGAGWVFEIGVGIKVGFFGPDFVGPPVGAKAFQSHLHASRFNPNKSKIQFISDSQKKFFKKSFSKKFAQKIFQAPGFIFVFSNIFVFLFQI